MAFDFQLTPEQEQKILDVWNTKPASPPSMKELSVGVFGEEKDGRSQEGMAIKRFLATRKLTARRARDPIVSPQLSETQKLFVRNNYQTMTATEMARELFNNPFLKALQTEVRTVQAYMDDLDPNFAAGRRAGATPTKAYTPPRTLKDTVEKLRRYLHLDIQADKLTDAQKKQVNILTANMNTLRFVIQMNNYSSVGDRELCEDAFVRATWDKSDLAQEEIDQYIEYANQVVTGFTVQRRSNNLQEQLEDVTANADSPDQIKISMSLVEAIGKASTEYHQCMARQQKLLDDLKQKRSDRISKQVRENSSILNLVQLWREEDSRKELLMHADREQAAVAKEVNRLSSLPDIKAKILGLTKEEILNG